MKNFKYTAINDKGKTVKGQAQGTNKSMVERFLELQNMSVVSVEEHNTLLTRLQNMTVGATFKPQILSFYLKQLGALLGAGQKLIDCLEMLAAQQKGAALKRVCFILYQEVYNGSKLSKAFELFPADFPPIVIAMTEAGEATGELADVLLRTVEYMDNQRRLNGSIKKAIRKPMLYLVGSLAVAVVMTLTVFPQFMSLFDGLGDGSAKLPIFTQIFIEFLAFLKSPWGWGSGILIVILVVLFIVFNKTSPKFRRTKTLIFLKTPGFGKLIQMNQQIVLASTLSQLMGRGVGATEALEVTKKVTTNPIFQELLEEAHTNVVQGKGFAKAFSESEFIDPIMKRMIETGEKTSQIPQLLASLDGYFNEVADVKVKQITATIQPVVMLFVYAIVMCLLMAIMLPQLQLATSV
ncbi:MAG: type II secretion system F family protein [bacterium]|nr:type II secretion system F family protein [bacterium]